MTETIVSSGMTLLKQVGTQAYSRALLHGLTVDGSELSLVVIQEIAAETFTVRAYPSDPEKPQFFIDHGIRLMGPASLNDVSLPEMLEKLRVDPATIETQEIDSKFRAGQWSYLEKHETFDVLEDSGLIRVRCKLRHVETEVGFCGKAELLGPGRMDQRSAIGAWWDLYNTRFGVNAKTVDFGAAVVTPETAESISLVEKLGLNIKITKE